MMYLMFLIPFFLNCGDYISLLSGGKLKSPLHRVVNTIHERLSFVFFFYPNFNSILDLNDINQKYSLLKNQNENANAENSKNIMDGGQITFGEYIAEKWEQVRRKQEDKKKDKKIEL